MAKKFKRQGDYLLLWCTKVEKIIEIKECANGRIKSTFEVESNSKYKTCVYWNTLYAKVGDEVRMKGFVNKEDIFIVETIWVVPPIFQKGVKKN